MDFRQRLKSGVLYLDGGTGSILQSLGLKPGELPEKWNIERPDDIVGVAKRYYEAGSNVVYTNTFNWCATIACIIRRIIFNVLHGNIRISRK